MRKFKTKWKLKFKDYENHLQANQVKNEISHLESHKLDVDSLKENLKEFIRSNVFTLKSRKRFRRKKHNIIRLYWALTMIKNTVNWIYRNIGK